MALEQDKSIAQWLRELQLAWELTTDDIAVLTRSPVHLVEGWLSGRGEVTDPEQMRSAVPLVSIYRKLSVLMPNPEESIRWLTSPNAHFDKNRPIDIAASSLENLYWLAYYLDSIHVHAERSSPAPTHQAPSNGDGGKRGPSSLRSSLGH